MNSQNKTAFSSESDEVYQIICRSINIDSDRQKYTKIYDCVRSEIVNGLRKNELFNCLFSDRILCGSYADRLKITKPNEFDLVMRLTFPYNSMVHILSDTDIKGNVIIDLSKVLLELKRTKRQHMYEFLQKLVNHNGYLMRDKFQRWLEGRLTQYLVHINNQLVYDDKKLKLKYRKQGPAHTIEVFNRDGAIYLYLFAIDFVPGFQFEAKNAVSKKKLYTELYWEAIPVKNNGFSENSNASFRASYTEHERVLIRDKRQLKNTLRLLKKFRDMNNNLVNLKSYHIKTLFLWQNDEDPSIWDQSITKVIHIMFKRLEDALRAQMIPFFWDDRVNLLSKFSFYQIDSMYHSVRIARKALMSATHAEDILNIFLTKKEQRDMSPDDKEFVENTSLLDQILPIAKKTSLGILGALAAGTAIYFLSRAFRVNLNRDEEEIEQRRIQNE